MNETFLSIASLHNQWSAFALFIFDGEVALGIAFKAERRSQWPSSALEVKNSAPSTGAALRRALGGGASPRARLPCELGRALPTESQLSRTHPQTDPPRRVDAGARGLDRAGRGQPLKRSCAPATGTRAKILASPAG
jgi:hypothetical protein